MTATKSDHQTGFPKVSGLSIQELRSKLCSKPSIFVMLSNFLNPIPGQLTICLGAQSEVTTFIQFEEDLSVVISYNLEIMVDSMLRNGFGKCLILRFTIMHTNSVISYSLEIMADSMLRNGFGKCLILRFTISGIVLFRLLADFRPFHADF